MAIGAAQLIRDESVHGVVRANNGAVIAFGLAHLIIDDGTVAWAQRGGDGTWRLQDIAVLPGAPQAIASLGHNDLFAVWSHGYAIVFSTAGVSGVAECLE